MIRALSVTELISWGVLYYAFTVFIRPMQRSLHWSLGELTGAFSIGLLGSALASLVLTPWIDRRGTRGVMTLGSLAAGFLVLAWARVHSVLAFYFIWAGMGAAMAAVLYDPAFAAIATWFTKDRGRALAMLTLVAGFASILFVPLSQWLVTTEGWRAALTWLGGLLLVVTVPVHAWWLRRRPEDLGLSVDGRDRPSEPRTPSAPLQWRETLADTSFRWLTAGFALNMFVGTAVFVHLVPYLIREGDPPAAAAQAVAWVGIASLPGRFVLTRLGDRISRYTLTALIFVLQAVALAILLGMPGASSPFVFAIVFGTGFGAITPSRAALVADRYGADTYARINSAMNVFLNGARAAAPIGVAVVAASPFGYPMAIALLLLALVLAAFAVWRAGSTSPTGLLPRRPVP